MRKQKIQAVLKDALEKEIPSSDINLWPAIKSNFAAGKHKKGTLMNILKTKRALRFALAFSMLVTFAAVFSATSPGQAIAQSILELFTRAESTAFPVTPFPLDDFQIGVGEPTQTQVGEPDPTDLGEPDPNAPTAEYPVPLVSLAEAEAQVGFSIAELPFAPVGFSYLGIRVYGTIAEISYQAQRGGGALSISQSQEGFNQSKWDEVPEEAIIPVMIGDLEGEYVQGAFVVYPGAAEATWNPDAAIVRLRWVDNGIWFEIAKFGNVHHIEYLGKEEMIEMAESLTTQP